MGDDTNSKETTLETENELEDYAGAELKAKEKCDSIY